MTPECANCDRPMRTRNEPDDGRVIHQARGLCSACYSRLRADEGYTPPPRPPRPRKDPAEVAKQRAASIAHANNIRHKRIATFLTPTTIRPNWEEKAVCQQVGFWVFDNPADPELTAEARAICGTCPVRRSCVESSLLEEQGQPQSYRAGIRGGLTPHERVSLERQRRKKDAA